MDDSVRMESGIAGDYLVIRIPIELMIFAQRERPDFPMQINNVEGMKRWVSHRVLTFGGDTEQGITEFEKFLDEMFITAYEDGELWISAVGEG